MKFILRNTFNIQYFVTLLETSARMLMAWKRKQTLAVYFLKLVKH